MDDDLLFGGQHRFSPDRQWAGSPPSCSQQDDGYRITWGASMNSVLASCKVTALQPPSKAKGSGLLANVKRSSASAGFPSPTRPQASTSNNRNHANTSLHSASDTSCDTSTGSASSSKSASRLSKRRRRFLPSSSTPLLDFDVSAPRSNTSHGPRSLSLDDSTSDVTEMLGELARRLEANRNIAVEKESHARLPLANKENVAQACSSTESGNGKGKQREKVAVSPAVSTVVEESMSQGMAGMLLNSTAFDIRRRPELGSMPSSERVRAPLQPTDKQVTSTSTRSVLHDSGYTSREKSSARSTDHLTSIPDPPPTKLQPSTRRAVSSSAVFADAAKSPLRKSACGMSPVKTKDKISLQVDEDLWDENDKSLEMAMSQMDIPDPPSSQQGGRSQSTSALNLPVPPARLRQDLDEHTAAKWEGFKSRDKRTREKSSDSSTASVGKLSSKPLSASQTRPARVVQADAYSTLPISDTKTEAARSLSKSTSASSDKLKIGTARPMMASARSFGANGVPSQALNRKFKCPTITNTAAAKAEQEKKAAAAAKLVKQAGQPLPANEAWMEDMDWNDDSFQDL